MSISARLKLDINCIFSFSQLFLTICMLKQLFNQNILKLVQAYNFCKTLHDPAAIKTWIVKFLVENNKYINYFCPTTAIFGQIFSSWLLENYMIKITQISIKIKDWRNIQILPQNYNIRVLHVLKVAVFGICRINCFLLRQLCFKYAAIGNRYEINFTISLPNWNFGVKSGVLTILKSAKNSYYCDSSKIFWLLKFISVF